MNNMKTKYIFSVIIDILITDVLVLSIIRNRELINSSTIVDLLIFIAILQFFLQDFVFNGNSIGKLILSIKLVSAKKEKRLSILQVIMRRWLELFYTIKIVFKKLYINIDGLSISRIEKVQFEYYKFRTNYNRKKEIKLKSLRLRAFLIDASIVSWAIIVSIIIRFPDAKDYIDDVNPYLWVLVAFFSQTVVFVYFVAKDIIFSNKSIGMKKCSILVRSVKIVELTQFRLLLRNLIIFFIFPIEMIRYTFNIPLISEILTSTQVVLKKPE